MVDLDTLANFSHLYFLLIFFVNMYLLLSFQVFAFSNQGQQTQQTKKHPKKLGIPDRGSQVHGGHGPEMTLNILKLSNGP